jgi:hypothetical protein
VQQATRPNAASQNATRNADVERANAHRKGMKMKPFKGMKIPKTYAQNKKSKYPPGTLVRFFGPNNSGPTWDTVRDCFWQECKCKPYGDDLLYPALVLTNHSWIAESDVIE